MLYAARHGQTILNIDRRYYGRLDPSLTHLGRQQALDLAQQLRGVQVDQVIVSSRRRTQETAALILQALDICPRLRVIPDLDERDFGCWEGLTADEVSQLDPIQWQHFLVQPLTVTPTAGEAIDAYYQRVERGYQQLLTYLSTDLVTLWIGHLGTMRTVAKFHQASRLDFWDIQFQQGQVYAYQGQGHWTAKRTDCPGGALC